MKHIFLLLSFCALLCATGCRRQPDRTELFGLPGVWMLSSRVHPMGVEFRFPEDGMTYCRIFDRDTMYYDCKLMSTPTGVVVIPQEYGPFNVVVTANRDTLFFENSHLRPIAFPDDTTMVIRRYGTVYTYYRNQDMTDQRVREIKDIIRNDTLNANDELTRYVLSVSERRLQAVNSRLIVLTGALLLAVLLVGWYLRRLMLRKREVERQLAQIKEEQAIRPSLVTHAMKQVEDDFFRSDYFIRLRNRVTGGEVFRKEDWEELEREVCVVWPDLFRHLSGLYPLSEVEWRVSLLVRLRFSPSEMAGVLCKDISSISSIRARLYRKVFHRSGGAKDWDDFILSL